MSDVRRGLSRALLVLVAAVALVGMHQGAAAGHAATVHTATAGHPMATAGHHHTSTHAGDDSLPGDTGQAPLSSPCGDDQGMCSATLADAPALTAPKAVRRVLPLAATDASITVAGDHAGADPPDLIRLSISRT